MHATVLRPEYDCLAARNVADVEKIFSDTIYGQANENRKRTRKNHFSMKLAQQIQMAHGSTSFSSWLFGNTWIDN
jgi:hypothetical protein